MKRLLSICLTACLLLPATARPQSNINASPLQDSIQSSLSWAAPCFTNNFNPNHRLIAVWPAANENVFYRGEAVRIGSSAPIEVYRLTYGGHTAPVKKGGRSLAMRPAVGHYFVQSGSDRTEFVVLPADYRKLTSVGHDDDYAKQYNRLCDRAKLGWVRASLDWGYLQTNTGEAINWIAQRPGIDEVARLTNYFGRENIILGVGNADWAYNLPFTNWLAELSNFVAAAHARYGKNRSIVRVDPLGEIFDGHMNTNLAGNYSALATQVYHVVSVAWPGVPSIGPSESSPGSAFPALYKAAGADAYLDAVDYHDYYNGYGDHTGDPDDPVYGVVAGRAVRNLSALGKTNLFVTELGLLGSSSLGCPNDPAYVKNGDCDAWCATVDSVPPYGWYRGVTRAIRTAVLYAQYRAVVLIHLFATGGAMDVTGIDKDAGIKPKTSAFLMTSHWLNRATPVTNWVSGNLHFAESVWAKGKTNTFVWASEGTMTTTNLGVPITDIWSNSWNGAIGEEPVIAWGWPPP